MGFWPSLVLSTAGYYGVSAWIRRVGAPPAMQRLMKITLVMVLLAWSLADMGAALTASGGGGGAGEPAEMLEARRALLGP